MKVAAIAILGLFTAPVAAQDIVVSPERSSAGYELLTSGQNAKAIALLRGETSEPSRLINLGTAHARLGQRAEAARAYRLALFSDDRYDVQLANGRIMDSRAAARSALARIDMAARQLAIR